jgi:small subunit ribosomal protein S3Ae
LARRKTRVKDKWREKRWVTVYSPKAFGERPVESIPITDDKNAVGRVIEVTLYDILRQDQSQHQFKIYFQIDKVEGDVATSIFKRYEYAKEFLRSLVRRGSSKINYIIDAQTKDGYTFRLKVIALTHRQLNTSRKHALRLIIRDIIEKTVPNLTIDQFVQETYMGKISSDIMAATKKVIRVRHVGLEKVKLVQTAQEQITLLKA